MPVGTQIQPVDRQPAPERAFSVRDELRALAGEESNFAVKGGRMEVAR